MACPRALTEDGLEMQLGVNHLAHFLFTCLLLPRIRASGPARIITLSSLVHAREYPRAARGPRTQQNQGGRNQVGLT